MPATYTLIASNTLLSAAASVTFSSIPATYTDLVLRCAVRGTGTTTSTVQVTFNGSTSSYSYRTVLGNGSSASSGAASGVAFLSSLQTRNSYTANTFSNNEIYIPSYTVSQNKPVSLFNAQENNAASAVIQSVAGLWRDTNAINQVTLAPDVDSFAIGSSFFLYGIKNS